MWNGWAFREDDMKLEQHKPENGVETLKHQKISGGH